MGYAALHLMVLMGGASGVLKILITFRGATSIQYRDFFWLGVRRHALTTDSWLQSTSLITFCKISKSRTLITLTRTGPLSSSENMGAMPRGATGLSRIELVVCQ